MMENSDSWIKSYFGILGAGCIFNALSLRISDDHLLSHLKFAQPKYLVITPTLVEKCKRLNVEKYTKIITIEELLNYKKFESKRNPLLRDNLIYSLNYSSGTTGPPKAMMLRHSLIFKVVQRIVNYFNLTSEDKYFLITPLQYLEGLGWLHSLFYVGGLLIIEDNTLNYRDIINHIIEEKATIFSAMPLTFKVFLENYLDEFKKLDSCLRILSTSSAPMDSNLIKLILDNTKDLQFYTDYGLNEAPRATFISFRENPDKLKSVGKPASNVQVKIVDSDSKEIVVPNKKGTVYIGGNTIFEGYWMNKKATEGCLIDGWVRTNDEGYYDSDGYIYLLGRNDDVINIGGEKVSLYEIDEAISSLDFVKDVGCIEKNDTIRDFIIIAVVVIEEDYKKEKSEEELTKNILDRCKTQLENYKIPRKILFWDSIPRSDSGKIQRKYLKEKCK